MDLIELQAEAVKQGYTLVSQNDFYRMGRIVEIATEHVNTVHEIMAAFADGATECEVKDLRTHELEVHGRLVDAIFDDVEIASEHW